MRAREHLLVEGDVAVARHRRVRLRAVVGILHHHVARLAAALHLLPRLRQLAQRLDPPPLDLRNLAVLLGELELTRVLDALVPVELPRLRPRAQRRVELLRLLVLRAAPREGERDEEGRGGGGQAEGRAGEEGVGGRRAEGSPAAEAGGAIGGRAPRTRLAKISPSRTFQSRSSCSDIILRRSARLASSVIGGSAASKARFARARSIICTSWRPAGSPCPHFSAARPRTSGSVPAGTT